MTIDSNISNVGTFSQISTGVTLLAKGGEAISQPDFTGTMRFDAQIGEKLEGWGLTAQFRMQF